MLAEASTTSRVPSYSINSFAKRREYDGISCGSKGGACSGRRRHGRVLGCSMQPQCALHPLLRAALQMSREVMGSSRGGRADGGRLSEWCCQRVDYRGTRRRRICAHHSQHLPPCPSLLHSLFTLAFPLPQDARRRARRSPQHAHQGRLQDSSEAHRGPISFGVSLRRAGMLGPKLTPHLPLPVTGGKSSEKERPRRSSATTTTWTTHTLRMSSSGGSIRSSSRSTCGCAT